MEDILPPHELPSVWRFGRHDAADKPMVDAARLAFELLMPTEDQGQYLLPAPSNNLYWMRRLFEKRYRWLISCTPCQNNLAGLCRERAEMGVERSKCR